MGDSPGFQDLADEHSERPPERSRKRLTARRVAIRLAVALLALAALDAAVVRTLPAPDYERAYRLPRTQSTTAMGGLVRHLDATASDGRAIRAAFLGASPTWGHRVRDARHTWPEAWEAAARATGADAAAYDLACNGQLIGDERVIGERVADDVDVVFVQLTYHTFKPRAAATSMRFPELPRLLGASLPADERARLGIGSDAPSALSAPVARVLQAHWALYAGREQLDARLFGGTPRDVLAGKQDSQGADTLGGGFASFDALDPARQMVVVSQYAEESSFTLGADDPQVRELAALARSLKAHGVKAVFYLSPLNRQLVEDYQLLDAAQYARNVAVLRAAVTPSRFPFVDYNSGRVRFGSELFADVDHTTDAGAVAVGRALFADTRRYVFATGSPRSRRRP